MSKEVTEWIVKRENKRGFGQQQQKNEKKGKRKWPHSKRLGASHSCSVPDQAFLFSHFPPTVNWFSARKQTIRSQWAAGTLNEYSLAPRRSEDRRWDREPNGKHLQEIIQAGSWAIVTVWDGIHFASSELSTKASLRAADEAVSVLEHSTRNPPPPPHPPLFSFFFFFFFFGGGGGGGGAFFFFLLLFCFVHTVALFNVEHATRHYIQSNPKTDRRVVEGIWTYRYIYIHNREDLSRSTRYCWDFTLPGSWSKSLSLLCDPRF